MKLSWKTAFYITAALLGWVIAIEFFVILNQTTTIDMQKKKCAELEGDLKALIELLPGKLNRSQLSGHRFQRLLFLYNEKDTLAGVRYQWDKFR
jgi:hypothetical protein